MILIHEPNFKRSEWTTCTVLLDSGKKVMMRVFKRCDDMIAIIPMNGVCVQGDVFPNLADVKGVSKFKEDVNPYCWNYDFE